MHWRPDTPCHFTWSSVQQPQSDPGESLSCSICWNQWWWTFPGPFRWHPGVRIMIPMTMLNKMVSRKLCAYKRYKRFLFVVSFTPNFINTFADSPMQIFWLWNFVKVRNCGLGHMLRKVLGRNTPSGTQQLGCPLSMTQIMLWDTQSTHDLKSGMFVHEWLFVINI